MNWLIAVLTAFFRAFLPWVAKSNRVTASTPSRNFSIFRRVSAKKSGRCNSPYRRNLQRP